MNIKEEIEIKMEKFDFGLDSYQEDSQIFPDVGTNSPFVEEIKIEKFDEKEFKKSELRESQNEHLTKEPCSCKICTIIINKGFSTYDFNKKKSILSEGRPTPVLNITTVGKKYNRKFNNKLYEDVEWLAGCAILGKVFCWPCILFSKEKNVWNYHGYKDVSNVHKAIKKHSLSENHLKSVICEKKFGKVRIDYLISKQKKISDIHHNKLVKKNRDIMKRYIDVVCFLGKNELALKGDDELENSVNRGNYVELIHLLKDYDVNLCNFLDDASSFTLMSNIIQNDLIESVSHVLRKSIKDEVEKAKFVSIMLDETTDVTNISHLSFMIRYALHNKSYERFLGFINLSLDRTADAIYKMMVDQLQELSCKYKLIAQGYDGAAVIAGEMNVVQSRVKEKYPYAMFIHCFAHRLNLSLSQAVSKISECKGFFMTLNGIAVFFSHSSKRTDALNRMRCLKELPIVSPTQWNYYSRLVETVYECRTSIIDVLDEMIDPANGWDQDSYNSAAGYLMSLKKFEFSFLLHLFNSFFPLSDALFDVLQSKRNDIGYCIKKINEFEKHLKVNKNKFECIWEEMEKETDLFESGGRNKKLKGDDLQSWYCKLYNDIYEKVIDHTSTRFKNLDAFKFLELLDSNLFAIFNKEFPEKTLELLRKYYNEVFDFIALKSQLRVVYMTDDFLNKNIGEILEFISANELINAFSEVYNLGHLLLIFPAMTSSVERSFSSLKRIKTNTRNSHSQERLQSLALISIEKELLSNLQKSNDFYDDVIDHFSKKPRSLKLQFI